MTTTQHEQFLELAPPPPDEFANAPVTKDSIHLDTINSPTPDISPAEPHHRANTSNDSSLFDTNPSEHLASTFPKTAQHDNALSSSYYESSTPTKQRNVRKKKLRLFFSASDLLPTGSGSRIRSAYAVIYMSESQQQDARKHFSQGSVITSESGGTGLTKEARGDGHRSSHSSDGPPPSPVSPDDSRGTLLGRSERAQLCGRDVEFCRHIVLRYSPGSAPVLYIEVYGVEGRNSAGRSHLVGTTSVSLENVYSHRGFRVAVPLAPPPPPDDGKKRRIPSDAGKLRITAEDVTPAPTTYHLDVMCDGLRCARLWGNGRVKRAFYTIHVIATSDERCDDWVLLYRSTSVSMVKKKRFGGSMEYNYFSSRPLLATPGLLFSHEEEAETCSNEGILRKVQHKIKNRYEAQFFSMPSSSFALISPTRRLKLSIWEDHSGPTGANLVSDSVFTMAQLRKMKLGERLDMFVHSDIVGHATLKFEERCEAPTYFCLSIQMPDLVQ